MNRLVSTAILTLLLALTVWTYWGVRLNPFHFDDALFLQSPQVTVPGNPWYLLEPTQSRQLTYLSFYLNYRICGTRPEGYHLINLFLHCLNVLGVYIFTLLICRLRPTVDTGRLDRWLPLLAAAIFALHPIQSEVVNYVYQRSALLATLFSLAALVCFLLAAKSKRPAVMWLPVAAFVILASLSKETALVLPVVMALLGWVYSARPVFRPLRSLLIALSLLSLSGAAWVLYSLFRRGEHTVGLNLLKHGLSYLVSQAQVLVAYAGLIFWPSGLTIDHAFRPAPPLSAWSLSCWILLIGLVAIFFSIRRTKPEISFWGLTFFALLLPSSSIIPSADLMFEHRLYLPMAAGSALLAWLLVRFCRLAFRQEKVRAAALLALAAVALTACALVSRQRTYIWGDNIRLWTDAAEKAPDNARAHYNLGVAYLEVDRETARREFLKTAALQPQHPAALYNLGWLEQSAGRLDAARGYYEAAIRANPDQWQAHLGLANLSVLQGRPAQAVGEYGAAIRVRKDLWAAYESLASVQIQTGDPGGALTTLNVLLSMQPERLEARYLKAYALARANRQSEAEVELRVLSWKDRAGEYSRKIRELQAYLDSSPPVR